MLTKIKYGNTNTVLLRGDRGSILIDTDYAGTLPAFYKAIKGLGIKVSDITYVLATHYHPDHMGLISELMSLGVKLIIMETQMEHIHYSDEIYAREPDLGFKPIDESQAQVVLFEESRKFLGELGIAGEIISTPSHSADSISVLLDDGTCIVGDLEPLEYLEAYEENKALKADWDALLSAAPKRIIYAHANERTF
ncbi:MAG: MBL fold metallo-hydrolase [Clostridiales bacterium]|nr:MBL fold metallo-hydrolase [Clostridiales bacterium]